MFRRKSDDEVTSTLMDNGVYNVSESHQKEKERSDDPSPYNFLSAVKYAYILTFFLWWLPIVGPMITGYVTGRRSGKPWIGVLAASIALLTVSIVAMLLDSGLFGISHGTTQLKELLISGVPVFGPYFEFADQYLSFYLGSIQISTGVHLDIYIMTIAFAYIGGAMALQNFQEMGYVARHGGNNMTVQFHNNPGRKGSFGGGLFKTRRASRPASRSKVQSFDQLHEVGDDEVHGPVERGMERAQLSMLASRGHSKKNVAAMKRGQKGSRSSRGGGRGKERNSDVEGSNNVESSDWRFI